MQMGRGGVRHPGPLTDKPRNAVTEKRKPTEKRNLSKTAIEDQWSCCNLLRPPP